YCSLFFLFFFTNTPPTHLSTLSLHDALPICLGRLQVAGVCGGRDTKQLNKLFAGLSQLLIGGRVVTTDTADDFQKLVHVPLQWRDRKSTRLNSSHVKISYAVFCLKKKKNKRT